MAAFVALAGARTWRNRVAELDAECRTPGRSGRARLQRHAIEATIARLAAAPLARPPSEAETRIAALAIEAARVSSRLNATGRAALRAMVHSGLTGNGTLVPLFHLLRTAVLQRSRGFTVRFAGFEDAAPFDLLLSRDGAEAELVCDVISAEAGRDVHRSLWAELVDRVDPDLQLWLASHPGRYLLKLTLPQGLRGGTAELAALHARIRSMLQADRRADHDEAAVLRLDPLMLAVAQAYELGLMSGLRREFGHEAHLAVTSAGGGVFAMAARAGREDEVAAAIRHRMAAIAPGRLTGTRPGILAMFVDDTDRTEWRLLRERLGLEGEARQFLTNPEARCVVAVSFASRLELMGETGPDAAPDGELRFRNPSHPAAKQAGLAPAVMSSI